MYLHVVYRRAHLHAYVLDVRGIPLSSALTQGLEKNNFFHTMIMNDKVGFCLGSHFK